MRPAKTGLGGSVVTVLPRETLVEVPPRALGRLSLSVKAGPHRSGKPTSAIDKLRAQGCLKTLFPRREGAVESIVINTSGGLTGGDRLSVEASAGAHAELTLTSQAAERAYRAASGVARMDTVLQVADGGRLEWLPQELILFEGARLHRSLRADLDEAGALLVVEPVIFGRAAMGERLHDVVFHDRLDIWRAGRPLFCDALCLEGNLARQVESPAVAGGAGAMALVVLVDKTAGRHLEPLRALLPETGGVTLVHDDVLVARVLAEDGFALRQCLVPALQRLAMGGCPVSWRL